MSTVLENKPPFLENFGCASLLAEDGRQMHKSWGNSIEFNDAADKMGVDTMRWLYCTHKPENDLLFRYHRAEDVRLLGPKLGADFPKVSAALKSKDPAQIAALTAAGEEVKFELNGDTVVLTGEEILVSTLSAENMAVAADKVVTVGIDTVVTPELKTEGLAREIVRRIQTQRKNADFNIEDRMTIWYVASGEFEKIFAEWSEFIRLETLTTKLTSAEPPADAFLEDHKINSLDIKIGVKKN